MMEPMDKIIERIHKLSKGDKKNTIEKCIKIQEEVGELSAEILKLRGKKGANGSSKAQIEENILEECCDIIIITHSLIKKLKYNKARVISAFHRKLDKVEANLKKQRLWKGQLK